MTTINIEVNGATATATANGKITSGMVGVPVNIKYDGSWHNLVKTASFRVGSFQRSRKDIENTTTVPWEVLRNHGGILEVGIEGRNELGDIVIPTVWARVTTVLEGAVPAVDGSAVIGGPEIPDYSAAIDDSVVSTRKAWSSKNIVDKLCPSFTETGVMVTCEPVEGYPLEVTADAEATEVTRCGKNLAKLRTQKNYSLSGMSSVVDGDATVFNGTSAIAANNVYLFVNVTFPNGVMTRTTPPKFQPGKYVLKTELVSGTISGATIVLETTPKGGTAQYSYVAVGASKTIEFSTTTFISPIMQFSANGTAENARVRIQIERGNTATAFEPYNGGTFNPGETIPALPGVNTIFADVGEITVAGRADPNAINRKTAERLAALEAALVNT